MSKAASKLSIETHAEQIREQMKVPRQEEVFKAAVEAGYLTALADGGMDDAEKAILIQAVEMLSKGLIIEWETEALIDEVQKHVDAEGLEGRAAKVGEKLKELDQVETGLFVAAIVARTTKGVEKSEAELLKAIAKAAGVGMDVVKDVVKRTSTLTGD
jgi:tellurite resistance protein